MASVINKERIRLAMDALPIDQTALAKRVGCTPGAISQIVSGTSLRSKFLPDIADVLGVSVRWLRAEDDEGGPGSRPPLPDLPPVNDDSPDVVHIELLPTFAGAGGGGTGDGDHATVVFARSLIEFELRAHPTDVLAVQIEGDSMEPDFRSGDQVLVDKRRKSVTQPGAFCLWDGDGYVIKLLERIYDSEPPKVRVISRNQIYSPAERLVDEVKIMGRVVWFGRRV
jgi:phage repressor protein C with HTH and peptisase S24 domain